MQIRSHGSSVFWLLLATGLWACSSPLADQPRVVGLLDAGAGSVAPSLPDTAHAGVPFDITITTFGGGCYQPDGADIRTNGLVADITPYDRLPPPGTNCISILHDLPRSVSLVFSLPGLGQVRVHGRGATGDITLVGSITVVP